MQVTVAIVTYCSEKELARCLDSILACDVCTKVVVIDNGSTDGSLRIAEEYSRQFRNVIAISSGSNIGLAAANNLVMPFIEGEYVLILNPDTVLQRGSLSQLVSILEGDSGIAAVGPKCLYEDGSPHTSYHHGWGLFHLVAWRVLPYSVTRRLYDRFARYKESEVGFVSGACLLARSTIFKRIGGYDPAYFLTVEDACDLCRRMRALGYKVLFTPKSQITHLCGRSGQLVPYLTTLEGYKGDIYYFRKYGGPLAGAAAYAIVTLACLIKVVVTVVKVLFGRRASDKQNLRVYLRILPQLLAQGPAISNCARR